MRHKVFGNHLGRRTNVAKALYRGLVAQVLENGRIETTHAKAKAIRADIDRVINYGKKTNIAARREVSKILGGDRLVREIFSKISPSLSDRTSGYTRIIRLGQRISDATDKVLIELVNYTPVEKVKVEKVKTEKIENKQEVGKKAVEKVKEVRVKKTAGVKKVIVTKKSGER